LGSGLSKFSREPAFSIFDKRLLFIEGGQCGSKLHIYDIENGKQYKIKD
jgi:hypothetical protein